MSEQVQKTWTQSSLSLSLSWFSIFIFLPRVQALNFMHSWLNGKLWCDSLVDYLVKNTNTNRYWSHSKCIYTFCTIEHRRLQHDFILYNIRCHDHVATHNDVYTYNTFIPWRTCIMLRISNVTLWYFNGVEFHTQNITYNSTIENSYVFPLFFLFHYSMEKECVSEVATILEQSFTLYFYKWNYGLHWIPYDCENIDTISFNIFLVRHLFIKYRGWVTVCIRFWIKW